MTYQISLDNMKLITGGHRFRQIPNQIKRLGDFFVSTIKSTINQDHASFRD
jgi:hypothetical protein